MRHIDKGFDKYSLQVGDVYILRGNAKIYVTVNVGVTLSLYSYNYHAASFDFGTGELWICDTALLQSTTTTRHVYKFIDLVDYEHSISRVVYHGPKMQYILSHMPNNA